MCYFVYYRLYPCNHLFYSGRWAACPTVRLRATVWNLSDDALARQIQQCAQKRDVVFDIPRCELCIQHIPGPTRHAHTHARAQVHAHAQVPPHTHDGSEFVSREIRRIHAARMKQLLRQLARLNIHDDLHVGGSPTVSVQQIDNESGRLRQRRYSRGTLLALRHRGGHPVDRRDSPTGTRPARSPGRRTQTSPPVPSVPAVPSNLPTNNHSHTQNDPPIPSTTPDVRSNTHSDTQHDLQVPSTRPQDRSTGRTRRVVRRNPIPVPTPAQARRWSRSPGPIQRARVALEHLATRRRREREAREELERHDALIERSRFGPVEWHGSTQRVDDDGDGDDDDDEDVSPRTTASPKQDRFG